ncbi:MAG: O-antigen ligase family protein [Chloroflexota bacterium]
MTARSSSTTLHALASFLWAATLLTLPVTSFRYFPAGEGTFVRPLAFFPLVLLLLTLLIQWVRRETTPPRAGALTALAAFLLAAVVLSLMGILQAPVPMRGQDVVGRTLRAWITLLMGAGFFVGAIWMNREEAQVRFSVRWLLAGFVIDILWSALQAATFYLQVLPKSLLTQWQRLFSLRELIRTNRVSGLAYEPSWLAGQIATVYLPWLLASLLTRVRVYKLRWLEPCLLAGASALVVVTFSRGGILTTVVSAGLTLLLVGRAEIRTAWGWYVSGFTRFGHLALRMAVLTVAVGALAGAGILLAQKGYISRLWDTPASDLSEFLVQNSAGARAAYLTSAIRTYEDHPWTGVGLGASGFYMYARLPDWALTTVPEIARQLSPENSLYPNPKNLYVRLLAETGVLGFILYLAFQFALLGDALAALGGSRPVWRFIGTAALCTWLALFLYNMTQDSFATPNLWINLGILAGVSGMQLKAGS